jgi:hypothetical protein
MFSDYVDNSSNVITMYTIGNRLTYGSLDPLKQSEVP